MPRIKGLATGIGSLPHQDADLALDLIFKCTPHIPFWPQLPKRDIREGMIAQFSENLPCLKLTRQGLVFDAQDKEKELEKFYEQIIAEEINYFKVSKDFASGVYQFYQRLETKGLGDIEFLKGQITGPFTFAASLKNEKGLALLHDPIFIQVILKGLMMKARWQINLFRQFAKKIIIFIDEPYLGCFGSGYTPINRQDVVKGLSEFTQELKSPDVLVGVHCCGNTDWSIFTEVKTIDIINFDVFGYEEKFLLYADNLEGFLKRGGIICWGVVPTQEFSGKETPELLARKIEDGIEVLVKKGLDKDLLLNNLLISPACGLGTLDIETSEKIFQLLSETSSLIQQL